MDDARFDVSQVIMRTCEDDPADALGYGRPPLPPADYGDTVEDGMRIIRNLKVAMPDGIHILIDIYLPEGAGDAPVLGTLIGWAAFGKHNVSDSLPPATGLPAGSISKHTGFEVPDPLYWTAAGYAVIYPDPRGTWRSEGAYYQTGDFEIGDAAALCEWAGAQPWSNGKVAFAGVSYPATIAWQVAARRPKHLAAIMPWEGFTDMYREFAYHGGIPETGHTRLVNRVMGWPGREGEDIASNYTAHPFDDAYWAWKNPKLEQAEVPAYVCASWADQGLHGRGTFEGFRRLGSQQKWLQAHGRQKWAEYYRPENIARQRMFFDQFVLGKDSGILDRAPVEIEVRERAFVGEVRAEQEWPPARTEHVPLFLDPATGMLAAAQPATAATLRYAAQTGRAQFDRTFDADTEITGYMSLRLWVEAEGSDDMDLFVGIQKLDAQGALVGFPYFAFHTDGPVALGWLRASHRERDEPRCRPGFPVHRHKRQQLLSPGQVVPVEISIWPSSTLFRAGETLRLIVQGRDIYTYPEQHTQGSHLELRNRGDHILHAGGRYDAHLLIPVIPRAG